MLVTSLVILFLIFAIVYNGIKVVPQQEVWIIERLGRFDRKIEAGLNFLIPFIDRVAYRHSLKEEAIDIARQAAITKDNVSLVIDGILYVKIIDPVQASYGVANLYFAVIQLAQTTMRSEIGKMTMDRTFEERDSINAGIVNSINEAATVWGVQCMRYEIKDINPPESVLQAMELQVAAERKKRAQILESEGKRQSMINIAEADKETVLLKSEAARQDQINRSEGEAKAITLVAQATADSIATVAASMNKHGGSQAASLRVAEQYVEAFRRMAKECNTLIVPANAADAGGMVAQALSIFNSITTNTKKTGAPAKQTSKEIWSDEMIQDSDLSKNNKSL